MGHDQLFKEFLRVFLRDFLRLFFPQVESRLDFGALRFLDAESFTSFPEGSSRATDSVAEVRTRDGARELLLIHIMVETRRKRAFAKRMFEYFPLLWAKHQVPIYPVARVFAERSFSPDGRRVRDGAFRARAAPLPIPGGGAVAAALASLMSRRRARRVVDLRISMMERVALSGLDEARTFLLLNLIETYFA